MKIQKENEWLPYVRTKIIENIRESLESSHFTQISQDALISLLSVDELKIAEIDVLAAVLQWVDCEVLRQGLSFDLKNRLNVFGPIKSYIVYTALESKEIADSKELGELLTPEERGSLLLHVSNKVNPLKIELKTKRKAGNVIDPYSKKLYFIVNKREIEEAERAQEKAKEKAERANEKANEKAAKKAAKKRAKELKEIDI